MIKDYSELVAEVTRRSGISGVANRAEMLVSMAEKRLRNTIRHHEMQKSVTITTDVNSEVDLPEDHLETHLLKMGMNTIPHVSLEDYLACPSSGYVIRGNKLYSPYAEADHILHYYAELPSLQVNKTNWLLEHDPEIYIQAVLFQVYSSESDIEKAQIHSGYLSSLIRDMTKQDRRYRYAGRTVNVGGY